MYSKFISILSSFIILLNSSLLYGQESVQDAVVQKEVDEKQEVPRDPNSQYLYYSNRPITRPLFVSEDLEKAIVLLEKNDSVNFGICPYFEGKVFTLNCKVIGKHFVPKSQDALEYFLVNLEIEFTKVFEKNIVEGMAKEISSANMQLLFLSLFTVSFGGFSLLRTVQLIEDDLWKERKLRISVYKYGVIAGLFAVPVIYLMFKKGSIGNDIEKLQYDFYELEINNILERMDIKNVTSVELFSVVIQSLEQSMDKVKIKKNPVDGSEYVYQEQSVPMFFKKLGFLSDKNKGVFEQIFSDFSNNMITFSKYLETLAISYMVLEEQIDLNDTLKNMEAPLEKLKERKNLSEKENKK
ncbi:MAG: hypothetical protein H6622_14615 [Halobacteriovoraceae bacterium]|nr:hypothetical protein [Halobacteriovoraceae bacterium]